LLSLSSIILVGNFNPSIFHPEWFERFKILPSQETQWAEGAKPKITEIPQEKGKIIIEQVPSLLVSPDLAQLAFPSQRIRVTSHRYESIAIQRENFQRTKEVTIKIFSILIHTPIQAMGINFHGHWKFKEDSDIILKSLFSKKDQSFRDAMGENFKIEGQISSLQANSKLTLRIGPSDKIQEGIHFNANFHRDIESSKAEQAIQLIQENFDKDLEEVIRIARAIIGDPEKIWEFNPRE
jgi:hypothetical protein